MAKQPIFWALVSGWSPGGTGFRILAVTSVRGGQVYGRNENDGATHVREADVLHRFDSAAEAAGAQHRAIVERTRLKPAVDAARDAYTRLDRAMAAAVLAAAKGEAPPA